MSSQQLIHASRRPIWELGPLPLVMLALFVPGHMFGWALEWAWLALQLLCGTVALLCSRHGLRETAGVPAMAWIATFVILTLVGCISAVFGHLAVQIPLDNSDAADLLRLLLFIPLALHVSMLLQARHLQVLNRALKACVLLNLLCSIVLVAEIRPLSDAVLVIYEEAKVQYAIHHIRIGIPFTNPNFAALMFMLMLSVFLFFSRSLLFATLTLISIVLTGSRSGYIAAAPLLLLAYIDFAVRAVTSPKRALVFVLTHVVLLRVASDAADLFGGFSRVTELVTALQGGSLGQVNTANIRFEVIDNAFRFIETSPLLGVGPARSIGLDVVDSQIVSWPLTYGVPAGVWLYGLFIAPMIILALRARQTIQRFAALTTGLSFFLMLGTGDFMKNYRLFYLSLVMMQVMHLAVFFAGRGTQTSKTPSSSYAVS
jgi:hypothetical protein